MKTRLNSSIMMSLNKTSNLRLVRALIIPVVIAGLSLPAAAENSDKTREVLIKMSINARQTGYVGRKVIIDFSRQAPNITHYRVFRTRPELERKDYPELGRTIIRKKGWVWQYYPEKALIIKKKAPLPDDWDILQQKNLELVMKNYYVQLDEGMTILGRRSTLVKFSPLKPGSRPTRKVWIDKEKGLPLRREVYGVDGNLYLISHFELLDYNAPVGKETFDIKAPKARLVETDAEITEGDPHHLNSYFHKIGLYQPESLPPGFILKHLRKSKDRHEVKYQLFYSDGLSALSFFQSRQKHHLSTRGSKVSDVMVGNVPARFYDFGLIRILAWEKGGQYFALVCELTKEEIINIAGSTSQISQMKGLEK